MTERQQLAAEIVAYRKQASVSAVCNDLLDRAATLLVHSESAPALTKGSGNFVERLGGEVTPTGRPPEGVSSDKQGEAIALATSLYWECHNNGGDFLATMRDLAARLTPSAERPRVPDGWKLVPVEPTGDMIDAGGEAPKMKIIDGYLSTAQLRGGFTEDRLAGPKSDCAIAQVWKAMVAASPVQSATTPITAQRIHEVYQEEFYRKSKDGKSLAHPTHADLIKATIHRVLGVEITEPWDGEAAAARGRSDRGVEGK